MRWRRLETWPHETLWHGTVLRLLRATWPHESTLDLMLLADPSSPSGFSLVVTTGYKAGLLLVTLPAEARCVEENVLAVSRAWLVANWHEWIYPTCRVAHVRIIGGYPPGITAPSHAARP